MNEDLLPPPAAPAAPFPWRRVTAAILPFAALAAAVGVQRLVEGASPSGDALARWVWYTAALGVALGALAGLVFGRRLLFTAWGVASPLGIIAFVAFGVPATLPLREKLADLREQRCLASGRTICSARAFKAACTGARDRLGSPEQKICEASGCTLRWTYRGPWRPDSFAGDALLCSAVLGPSGGQIRASVLAIDDPRR